MSKSNKAYKFRIYPNAEQQTMLTKTFGCVRLIYNYYLNKKNCMYNTDKSRFSYTQCSNDMTLLKKTKEFAFLKEVDSVALQQSLRHLDTAFQNFFKRPIVGFPKFKSKKINKKSYSTIDISILDGYIRLPKVGYVKMKQHRVIPDNYKLKSATISQTPSGKYYASVLFEYENQIQEKELHNFLGLDFSMHELYKDSNGTEPNYPRYYRKSEQKLKREQRSFSRKYENYKEINKLKGGATRQNIQKQKLRIQKLYHKLDNIRTDYINKVISNLVKTKPKWITIEDLNVSGMMRNRHLSKAIAQQKFFEFRMKLLAKCKEYGVELRLANRFYPSSKTCHNCGNIKPDLKLSDRIYHCSKCGYIEDRDYNASLNLRDCLTYTIA